VALMVTLARPRMPRLAIVARVSARVPRLLPVMARRPAIHHEATLNNNWKMEKVDIQIRNFPSFSRPFVNIKKMQTRFKRLA
jgi:hypothetical protein